MEEQKRTENESLPFWNISNEKFSLKMHMPSHFILLVFSLEKKLERTLEIKLEKQTGPPWCSDICHNNPFLFDFIIFDF